MATAQTGATAAAAAGQARMAAGLTRFNAEVSEFVRRIPLKDLVAFHKKIALEVLRRVVLRTPVDTGRARGNWQTSIGMPAEGEIGTTDPTGASALAQGQAVLAALPPFSVVYINNGVPYIEALEGGWSRQAPAGMVAITLAEMIAMFP